MLKVDNLRVEQTNKNRITRLQRKVVDTYAEGKQAPSRLIFAETFEVDGGLMKA